MQNYKSKTEITQLPTKGRATNSITPLLNNFFDGSSFDDTETLLSDLLQAYISPDPDSIRSNEQIANTVFAVREIANLLRKLEAVNKELGGKEC